MIKINTEQLKIQLKNYLCNCYLLFGNDQFLLQESQDLILKIARKNFFNAYSSITLENNFDWSILINICKNRSLFTKKQILLLILPEEGINLKLSKQLFDLSYLLHEDLLFIIRGNKLTYDQEISAWFQSLSKKATLIICNTPKNNKLYDWIIMRIKNMKISLDENTCQLLCYYYEDNLLALNQLLMQLSIIYPNNEYFTIHQVEMIINDSAQFTLFHWINATLAGEDKRAIHILKQLELNYIQPVILLRNLQKDLLLILNIKRQINMKSYSVLFNIYKVWQTKRQLLMKAIERLTIEQIRNAINLMSQIEQMIKMNNNFFIWFYLHSLTLLLCGKELPSLIING